MIHRPFLREKLRLWLKSSKILAPVKKLIPDVVKSGLLNIGFEGLEGTIDLGGGVELKYALNDFYWPRYANDIHAYEPEMWFVMDLFVKPGVVFIDCGANIGLWSCYAASKIGDKDKVIAVECGDTILPLLRENQSRNKMRFTLLEKAIWSRSGETKVFSVFTGAASSSLVAENSQAQLLHQISVETITIDDIVTQVLAKYSSIVGVVVKLDVEGVEREALIGAARTLASQNTLVIYEDHGKDVSCKATAAALELGLSVYFPEVKGSSRSIYAVSNLTQVHSIKKDVANGYNFLACVQGSVFAKSLSELTLQKSYAA